MKTANVPIALLLAICLAGLTACGDEGGPTDMENDLAIMVLPLEDLAEEFADFQVSEGGFQDNDRAVDGTIDPADTADDLERAGRVNGYSLLFSVRDLESLVEVGEGAVAAFTSVDLFADAEAASSFLAARVDDWEHFEGEEIQPGLVLEEVEWFAAHGLGDEAAGSRREISQGGMTVYQTVVTFRLGRLLATAGQMRVDSGDVNSQVEEMARTLEARIEGVLLGDIRGTPVPAPQVAEGEEGALPSFDKYGFSFDYPTDMDFVGYGLMGSCYPVGEPSEDAGGLMGVSEDEVIFALWMSPEAYGIDQPGQEPPSHWLSSSDIRHLAFQGPCDLAGLANTEGANVRNRGEITEVERNGERILYQTFVADMSGREAHGAFGGWISAKTDRFYQFMLVTTEGDALERFNHCLDSFRERD